MHKSNKVKDGWGIWASTSGYSRWMLSIYPPKGSVVGSNEHLHLLVSFRELFFQLLGVWWYENFHRPYRQRISPVREFVMRLKHRKEIKRMDNVRAAKLIERNVPPSPPPMFEEA